MNVPGAIIWDQSEANGEIRLTGIMQVGAREVFGPESPYTMEELAGIRKNMIVDRIWRMVYGEINEELLDILAQLRVRNVSVRDPAYQSIHYLIEQIERKREAK